MEYLIFNEYNNQQNKTYELRNRQFETLAIRSALSSKYVVGDFVQVEVVNNKNTIIKKLSQPVNHLDYYKHGPYTPYQLRQKLEKYIEKIENEKFRLILEELVLTKEDFFLFPAGKSLHHAYIGGLCDHVINLLELSGEFIRKYDLDQDLLYTGIILHDYGKLRELKQYGITYSIEGNMLGHIVMCVEEIANIAINMGWNDDMDIYVLKHMILSHHGRLDYGSPKEPMTIEAYVLSQLDELDAKLNLLNNTFEKTENNKMTQSINGFDRRRFLKYNKGE